MFLEEKKRTNYASICLIVFFCCVFGLELARFAKSYSKTANWEHPFTTAIEIATNNKADPTVPCNNAEKSSSDHTRKTVAARADSQRERPPSTYCVKIGSFTKLADSLKDGKYESRPFRVGGHNWTLIMYPKGNKDDSASGWVSLYVKIDNSTLIADPRDVYAEIKFFIYNTNVDKYYTYRETEPRRFHLFNTMWGYPKVQTYDVVRNPAYGYVFDGDQLVFGVDVFVAPDFDKWEVTSFAQNFHEPKYTWGLRHFSSLDDEFYVSEDFYRAGRNWYLKIYPNGDGIGRGNSLSMYIVACNTMPYEKMYLRAKLRVLDQRNSNSTHAEKLVDSWSDTPGKGWGFPQFISFSDLRNSSKGFVVDNTLKVEVEFLEFTKTDYFPSKVLD
ncbi:PREDICTED: probable inactive serine/threonine-protein kinase fnkC [Tarenaya hassleriana]|uniref:probable inactive serine/threonine-protein kinase fnkC n=1 Tax=Tarenaya hassleriana TaxID=28532 RepID=UPI00053C1124|nr:PREDICTED: probable inactive serine/threonine-protein kinase fnkC [Tarenaya hassleriana]